MHINCVSVLGENKWYDAGDERFHPDNLIFDARNANILAIISKKTGEIVWQIGPDFSKTKELRKLGWIIGQHHFHMIPKGLPGEGNLLVFDNGGEGGYGNPNPSAPTVTTTHTEITPVFWNLIRSHWRSSGSTPHWKQEICYLPMLPSFTVPTSVLHSDCQTATH